MEKIKENIIQIKQGDITKKKIDVIVNPANESLLGGGGLDGQIHFLAGPKLLEECKNLNGCKKGEAKITKGYELPSEYIIHTVGPIFGYENGNEKIILENCYLNCLSLATKYELKSIAFPAIATGSFKFPKDEAAKIALSTVRKYIAKNKHYFKKIIFVLFTELDYKIYKEIE